MGKTRAEAVVLTIEDEPVAALIDRLPEEEMKIQVGSRVFCDAGFEDMNGFCDFLRGPCGIVGIRFWPFPAVEFLAALVPSGDKLVSTDPPHPSLCIYPRGKRDFDERQSGDQDMVKNYILKSGDGVYAITLPVDLLSAEDYGSLCSLLMAEDEGRATVTL